MDLLEKIDRLMVFQGINRAELARRTGIPYTTIDGFYKKGYANMKLSTLQKLADYFGISLDFLARDIEHPTFPLTDRERELVDLFRQLNSAGQDQLTNYARFLAADPVTKKDTDEKAVS